MIETTWISSIWLFWFAVGGWQVAATIAFLLFDLVIYVN